jgi:hypothetical protein
MKKLLKLSVLAAAVFATAYVHADTLSLTQGTQSSTVPDATNIVLNGSDYTTAYSISLDLFGYQGETWTVSPYAVGSYAEPQTQEEALAFNMIGTDPGAYPTWALLNAIYYFSGTYPSSEPIVPQLANTIAVIEGVVNDVDNGAPVAGFPAFDDGSVTMLYASWGSENPSYDGQPPTMIMATSALPVSATPEPTSLLLLATGLLGFASAYRKFKTATSANLDAV